MAEAQIVFKRSGWINKNILLSTYYKITVLRAVRETLLLVGGQDLLDRFVGGCFGHFTYWNPGSKSAMVVHHIISREITMPGANENEMWFQINGVNVRFSHHEYALLTGLSFGASTVTPTDGEVVGDNVTVFKSFTGGYDITVNDLLDASLNRDEMIPDETGDLYLKVAHVLVLYMFLLGYDPRSKYVEGWVWNLVDDLDNFILFPWGSYTYLNWRHYVDNVNVKSKYHFYGPVWVLICWAFEIFPMYGKIAGNLVDAHAKLRCIRWGFKSKIEGDLARLFELSGDTISPIQPHFDEQTRIYFTSSLFLSALVVTYLEPRNLIKEGVGPGVRRRHAQGASTSEIVDVGPSVPGTTEESDTVEHTTPIRTTRSTRERVKRARNTTISSYSSSGGGQGGLCSQDRRWIRTKISKSEDRVLNKMETRFMPRIKQWLDNLVELTRCGSSQ